MTPRESKIVQAIGETLGAIAAAEAAVMRLKEAAEPEPANDQMQRIADRIGLKVGESKIVEFSGRSWTMTRTQ